MLDACKACGWSQVHWRAFDGGRADYPSKVARPFNDWDEDNFFEPKTDEGKQVPRKYNGCMTPQRKQEILERWRSSITRSSMHWRGGALWTLDRPGDQRLGQHQRRRSRLGDSERLLQAASAVSLEARDGRLTSRR
jgi:hypothetical protein